MNMERIGIGNTAEVFAFERNKVCKLFHEGYPRECAEMDYQNSKLVNELNIPSPKAYELVKLNGRNGIIYDRLYGTSLLELLMAGSQNAKLVPQMVDLQKRMLEKHTEACTNYKDFLRGLLYEDNEETLIIRKKIDALPDGDCLCHGDYHPGNVWINENGEAQVIDFMNICFGPREYDIARTHFLITQGGMPEGLAEEQENYIRQMQQILGKEYLKLMRVEKDDLEKYLDVIAICRKYEA